MQKPRCARRRTGAWMHSIGRRFGLFLAEVSRHPVPPAYNGRRVDAADPARIIAAYISRARHRLRSSATSSNIEARSKAPASTMAGVISISGAPSPSGAAFSRSSPMWSQIHNWAIAAQQVGQFAMGVAGPRFGGLGQTYILGMLCQGYNPAKPGAVAGLHQCAMSFIFLRAMAIIV